MENIVQQFYDDTVGFRLHKPEWIYYLSNLYISNRRDVISKIFHYGDACVENFLLFFPDWWKDYTLNDWMGIINEQSTAFDILAVITFLYRHVEVDLVECFYHQALVNKTVKKEVLRNIGMRPGIFQKSLGLEYYDGKQAVFPEVKQRLMNEGVPAANYDSKHISSSALKLEGRINFFGI